MAGFNIIRLQISCSKLHETLCPALSWPENSHFSIVMVHIFSLVKLEPDGCLSICVYHEKIVSAVIILVLQQLNSKIGEVKCSWPNVTSFVFKDLQSYPGNLLDHGILDLTCIILLDHHLSWLEVIAQP